MTQCQHEVGIVNTYHSLLKSLHSDRICLILSLTKRNPPSEARNRVEGPMGPGWFRSGVALWRSSASPFRRGAPGFSLSGQNVATAE